MRLILIRHGQTPSNVRGLLDTAVPGPGLTELGLAQAAELPAALAAERIDAVYASTAVRTQLTAGPLAAHLGLPVVVRDGAKEIFAGDLEMASDPAAIRTYLSTVLAWAGGDLARRMPGGPDGLETLARFDAVIDEVSDGGNRIAVIVSHGAMIRTWSAARAVNLGVPFVARNGLGNTGAVVLERDGSAGDGSWRALTWMGAAVVGPALEDETEGPAGEPVAPPQGS